MKIHVEEKHECGFKTFLAPLCGLLSSNLTDMWSYDYPRLPKVLCPLWLWKNGKSMPTPITRAWNFLKRCADARVCITSHRYAYGVNIMTAFWIPVFNMPTFSSNKSQPSFKLGLQFKCNIEIMSSIFLEPIQESEWKVTFDSFLNIIILNFFFIRFFWF